MKITHSTHSEEAMTSDALGALWSAILASQFDLLLLAIGLACYLILTSARRSWKEAQQVDKLGYIKVHHEEQVTEVIAANTSGGGSESNKEDEKEEQEEKEYQNALASCVGKGEHEEARQLIEHIGEHQVTLGDEAINAMLTKCRARRDIQMAVLLAALVRTQSNCSDTTYSILIEALARNRREARAVIEEVLDRPADYIFPANLVLSILGFARTSSMDRPLVDRVFERANSEDTTILAEFIKIYLDDEQCEYACDIFELNFGAFLDNELGQDTEWKLMIAALKCQRLSVANHLFETSQAEATRPVAKIQKWWKHRLATQDERTANREQEVARVFGLLSHVFNQRFSFEEDSDVDSSGESTAFFGDDDQSSDFDSDYDASIWNSEY